MNAARALCFALAIVLQAQAAAPHTVLVYEDPTIPTKRTIGVHIAVYRAAHPSGDPVFLLTGGPGQTAVPQRFSAPLLLTLRQSRDLVFVDPRGTGESNPLRCELFQTPESHFEVVYATDAVAACREELGAHADVNLYQTWLAADDLDRVRTELGYRKIALYGDSYGARVALEYIRRYGNRVSAAVLSRADAPGTQLLLQRPQGAQWALNAVFRSCESDPVCFNRFPQLQIHFTRLLDRFSAGYADVTVHSPQSSNVMTVRMGRAAFVETVRQLLLFADTSALLPVVIEEAYTGNYEPIAIAKVRFDGLLQDGTAAGVMLSEYCSERVPFVTDTAMNDAARGSFYGTDTFRELQGACAVWNVRPVQNRYLQPVRTRVPVLAISAVPNETLLKFMPRGHQLLLNLPLATAQSPCADAVVYDFFVAPGAKRHRMLRCSAKANVIPFAVTLPASLSG